MLLGADATTAAAAERAAMVIDANTGKVLYAASADEPRYPASLTKMMTLYLTFELIERQRLSYGSRIKVSAQAASQPPSQLGLDAGDTISVRDAVGALVTKSANDVAVALAEHIAGSQTNFARLMTRKAREIGMSKTTFKNPHGLPDSDQVTTARDMLTLALRLQDDFPEHYKVFATRSFTYGRARYRNHNTLLYHYQGTDGIKTGYTRASGFNLVSSVRRGGRHLVAAVFGGRTAGRRNADMRNILDRAFPKASTRRTRDAAPKLIAEPRLTKPPARVAKVANKAEPAPAAPTKLARAPAATAADDEPSTVATAPADSNTAPARDVHIAIARVRPVGLSQHLAERRAARRVRHTAPDTPTSAPPKAESADSIAALITTSTRDSEQPSGLGMQVNGAIVPTPSAATPVGLVPSARAPRPLPARAPRNAGQLRDAAGPAAVPGRPPSTLQSQLSKIQDSPRQPESRAPTAPIRQALAADTHSGTHLIQIGAYDSADEAQRNLAQVRQRAAKVLRTADAVTEAVTRGDRQLYRANFAGFDSASATHTCQELRRQSIDCFVKKVR